MLPRPIPFQRGTGVLFIIRTLQFGGAERQLVLLARGLHHRGHRVGVMVFYSGGPLAGELERAGVPLMSLHKRGRWDLVGPLWRAVWAARRFHPLVLHGYLTSGNALALALRAAVPGSRTVWAIRSTMVDLTRYDWFTRVSHSIANRLARRADLIIANSRAGRADHVKVGYPEDRVVVIPNAVDVERFRPNEAHRQATRATWGIDAEEVVVGMVSRVDPMKDHPTFLRAAALVLAEHPRLRIVCIGNGRPEYRAEMERLADALGLGSHVLWLPAVLDVSAVYPALDVLCSASAFGEGFSNVLGEALASGVPCVATSVGDAAEVLGNVGMIVPPRDPVALAQALLATIAARSPALGTRCREHVVRQFGVERLLTSTAVALGLSDA